MNRFQKKTLKDFFLLRILFFLLLFLAVIFLLNRSIQSMNQTTLAEKEANLNRAVMHSISTCYALEGAYPPNLDYLEENYGLTYDDTLYYIDYHPIGSNLRPDVTIIVR